MSCADIDIHPAIDRLDLLLEVASNPPSPKTTVVQAEVVGHLSEGARMATIRYGGSDIVEAELLFGEINKADGGCHVYIKPIAYAAKVIE